MPAHLEPTKIRERVVQKVDVEIAEKLAKRGKSRVRRRREGGRPREIEGLPAEERIEKEKGGKSGRLNLSPHRGQELLPTHLALGALLGRRQAIGCPKDQGGEAHFRSQITPGGQKVPTKDK